MALTNEGLVWLSASVLLGLVGWLKSINLVLILAYTMAALLILNGWLARRQVRRVRMVRDQQPPVYAGEKALVPIAVTNHGRQPITILLEERTGDEKLNWLVHRLAGGASVTCSAHRVFTGRGRFRSSLGVASTFPLGLIRATQEAIVESEVVVLPAPGQADANRLRHWLARQAGGDGRARKVLRRVSTDQAEVRGVRPYRPGDPIRAIHWRSSARRGELMVREYDTAPSPDLVLVVEPWLPEEPTLAERARLEAALSLAVTIVRSWSEAFESRVTIAVAGDPRSIGVAAASEVALRHALTPLASVEGARSFDVLGSRSFDRSLQRAARLVVSSRRDSPYAAALTRATGRPFLAISPVNLPEWYVSPAELSTDR